MDDLVWIFIVGTRWHQGALRASPVNKQFSLKADGCFLKFLEAFALKKLPDFLLRQVLAAPDQLTLLSIKTVVKPRNRCSVIVPEWGEISHFLGTLSHN